MPDPWISWMPSWVEVGASAMQTFEVKTAGASDTPRSWRCMRPDNAAWGGLAAGLRRAAATLRAMPISDIVAALDRAAERWCDESWSVRRAARERVVEATGFSPEAVDRSFDVELGNYRADSLWRALRRELDDPRVLDSFQPDLLLDGATRAFGPGITLAVLTGNVPGLPALSLVRALLAKSGVIAKVASGEPTFASAFVNSLSEQDTRLGDAIVLTYWSRDDCDVLEAVVAEVDAVIAYGGEAACRAVRRAVRDGQKYVEHGHKFSAGFLSRDYVDATGTAEVARRVARDVAAFNQLACIAPQVYLIEGSSAQVEQFGAALADALASYSATCPIGRLAPEDAAAIQMRRASEAWSAVTTSTHRLWHDTGLEWTVAMNDTLEGAGGGHRYVRLVPVADVNAAVRALRPLGRFLQNLAVGVIGDGLWPAMAAFAEVGATRLCEPGRMADPSMMWRHDGHMNIGELLRWCDVEMHADAQQQLSARNRSG